MYNYFGILFAMRRPALCSRFAPLVIYTKTDTVQFALLFSMMLLLARYLQNHACDRKLKR